MGAHTVAGVDVGGTKITFAVWAAGSVAYREVLPYTARSSREFSDLVLKGIRDLQAHAAGQGSQIEGVGIGCAGMVDQQRGMFLFPPNMPGVRDVPLAQIVRSATGIPTFLENDANCALIAEWVAGVARGKHDVVLFTVGTGIGGALIVDGHLYVGKHGYAGELGHMHMIDGGLRCGCGRTGCLETISSGTGIARYVNGALARGVKSAMTAEDAASARRIAEFAHKGDPLAVRAFKRAAGYLGRAAATMINVLDPELVVVGGGVTESGLIMDEMQRVARKYSLPLLLEGVEFTMAQYRNDAGAIGAALLAQELLQGHPIYSSPDLAEGAAVL